MHLPASLKSLSLSDFHLETDAFAAESLVCHEVIPELLIIGHLRG